MNSAVCISPANERGRYGKKVLGMIGLGLFIGVFSGEATSQEEQDEVLNVHQRASACFDHPDSRFQDDPVDCEAVCSACHDGIGIIEGQLLNPEGFQTDLAIPGLRDEAFSDFDDEWADLPDLLKVCRNCHADQSEEMGNHPIFVEAFPNGEIEELKAFDGQLLCPTCHNPHIEESGLVRIANAGSALCQSCHQK